MAENESPSKIIFGIGQGNTRGMVRLADGTYADRTAPAYGAGLVTDNTGQFTFDTVSLAGKYGYDSDGNQAWVMYGPDMDGRRIKQTSQWQNGLLMADSDWQLVDANGMPVNGEGEPL